MSTTPLPGYSSHFGTNNIPFGIASSTLHPQPQAATRFEDRVIFLADLGNALQDIQSLPLDAFRQPTLNQFAALSTDVHQAVRYRLQELVKSLGSGAAESNGASSTLPSSAVEDISAITMHMPVDCTDFSDFSCSPDHGQNASEAMTGTRSLPPAFYHQPIGYAGRCSSLEISGLSQERPLGQYWTGKPMQSDIAFGPSRWMDYELELGAIIGKPLPRRERLLAKDATDYIFGFVLVNDWSARDIQGLEMIPLGPLNGKNLGTNISPWVVTPQALAAFRTASVARASNIATPKHLADDGKSALDIRLEVHVLSPGSNAPKTMCTSNCASMYWTLEQCLAQQALAGCGLRTGDLIATGTVSTEHEHGCLMEFMKAGTTPPRGYLEDRETVTLTGYCGEGVGFGECVGTLLAAREI